MGVNNKSDLALVESQFQKIVREKFLKQGVTLIDPNSVFFSSDTKIGKDVVIHPHVHFGVNVQIGDDVEIKSFCHLENTIIKNVLGYQGSLTSDFIFQSVGLIGYLLPVTYIFTGFNIFRKKEALSCSSKLVFRNKSCKPN